MNSRQCCRRQSSRSADFARPTCGCACRRTCAVASLDLVWDGKALAPCKGYRGVGDHQAPAIRLKDVGRRQDPATADDFPTFNFQPHPGGKK
jgi:hypothetical protein